MLLPQALRPVNQITQPLVAVEFLAFFAGNAMFVPMDVRIVGHGRRLLDAMKLSECKFGQEGDLTARSGQVDRRENQSLCGHAISNPGQLAQIGRQHRLRAAPDQKEQGFAAPAAGRMADDVAGSLCGRKRGLRGAQHETVGPGRAVPRWCTRSRPPASANRVASNPVLALESAAGLAKSGRWSDFRVPRYSIAALVEPTARVEVCKPPVPAPDTAAHHIFAGPASSHSRAESNVVQTTSPVWLADSPTSRLGRSFARRLDRSAVPQNLLPVVQPRADDDRWR